MAYYFGRLVEHPTPTVEFRIFPGTLDSDEIRAFADVALALVHAASERSNESIDRLLEHAEDPDLQRVPADAGP